jgi:hypothetical protein
LFPLLPACFHLLSASLVRFVSSFNSRKPNEAKVEENSSSGYAKILLDEGSESLSEYTK